MQPFNALNVTTGQHVLPNERPASEHPPLRMNGEGVLKIRVVAVRVGDIITAAYFDGKNQMWWEINKKFALKNVDGWCEMHEVLHPKSPTWNTVLWSARLMESKLALNRHKGDREGWLACSYADLWKMLMDEIEEIRTAAPVDRPLECSDAMNILMMIADKTVYDLQVDSDELLTFAELFDTTAPSTSEEA